MTRLIDLHIHSHHSDGIHSPAEIVQMAAELGLKAIALSDHDSVSGLDEALDAGQRLGVEVIPAVELSVEFGKYRDIHLLGYFIDHTDEGLQKKLADFRSIRDNRGRAIVERINRRLETENKPLISYDDVLSLAEGALGRPHIARILIARGCARDTEDAFRRYLIPLDVPKPYFPMIEALGEISRAGGISVLAHPASITAVRSELREIITNLARIGLDGLEVYNNMCFADDIMFLEGLAKELNLLITGGSDFHGFENDVELGIGRGGLSVSYRWLEKMKLVVTQRRGCQELPSPHCP